MGKIKKGDMVVRKSYNKDIVFRVSKISGKNGSVIATLKGVIERVEADSNIYDLEKVDKNTLKNKMKEVEKNFKNRIEKILGGNKEKRKQELNGEKEVRYNFESSQVISGTILHLDGDKRYSQKAEKYYKKIGLNAVVRNIAEYRQPQMIYRLLKTYNPDILIITGHDAMLKRNVDLYNIYNYKNSKYFVETVIQTRKYDQENNTRTVIFAGACQSYFEALISAGANFASSPARILIDFLDPIIVAEKIALTEIDKYVTIDDIVYELRDGKKGVNGIGARGKMRIKYM